jgi:methionine-gamma-lyase
MAGVLSTNDEWAARLRQVRILTGGNLHPMAAYTLHRGLQTLPVRVRAAQENAVKLADRLMGHPAVSRVRFPTAPGCDPHGLVGRQMSGPGTMISIDLAGGYEAARSVMASVGVFTPAVSLGSTDSLIQHPAGLTHRIVGEAAQAEGDIGSSLLRLSVGLEDIEDLWMDLASALEMSTPMAAK